MNKILILILLHIVAMPSQAQKAALSIMDLNVTEGLSVKEATMMTDKLINEFVNVGIYKVVERSKRDEILKEQGFQQSGACDQGTCLVEAGQLLGVEKMVGGSIGKIGSVFAVELRMMNVKTGEIERAFSQQYTGEVSILLGAMKEASEELSNWKSKPGINSITEPPVQTIDPMSSNDGKSLGESINAMDGSVLIEIPAGIFTIGSRDGQDDEKPVHFVYLDKYYIGKYEVTVGQFKKYCKATGKTMPPQPSFNNRDDYPVVSVSWDKAKAYCEWAGLRLPTEAEWEKAARGTDERKYPWGNEWNAMKCNSSGSGDNYYYTSPIGSFPSGISPYGCHDMAGNVWEWCYDNYDEKTYSSSPDSNPTGPGIPDNRVHRGGAWNLKDIYCRVATRSSSQTGIGFEYIGFRVAKGIKILEPMVHRKGARNLIPVQPKKH